MSIIQIPGFEGEEKNWRTLSERTQTLLKEYPPKDGWAVIINGEVSPISFTTQQGESVLSVKFTAQLLTPQGTVVASCSVLHGIDGQNAWPIGESRARHRLCEALGYGGEVLDLDEAELIKKMSEAKEQPKGTSTTLDAEPTQATPATPAEVTVPASTLVKPPKRAQGAASPLLINQIKERAAALGVPVPDCSTEVLAKAAWKELLKTNSGG